MQPLACTTSHNPCVSNASASSLGQVVVGGNVINFAAPPSTATSYPATHSLTNSHSTTYSLTNSNLATCSLTNSNPQATNAKPFVLKLKTKQVRICQSCRKNYDGPNDTLGLVVARAERRLVSNLVTGLQFLGKESNSHYHFDLHCIRAAEPTFSPGELVIPDDVRSSLSDTHRHFIYSRLGIYI